MSSGKVLLGVLAGLAGGALLGILLAPAKGSDTRKKYIKMGTDFTDELKNKFNETVDDISDKYNEVRSGASEFARKAHK
ncbi:MAG: YtxH domain-containing protein [Bacteroidales bacterium]|nr:YtxH domain-containing protein [Bacteroidales bacterium]